MENFNNLIDTLYREHLESVAIENGDPDLQNRFREYMIRGHGACAERVKSNPALEKRMLNEWYQDELRYWGRLSSDRKYARFTPDPAHIELWNLSALVSRAATRKLTGEEMTDEDKANVCAWVEQMKQLRPGVLKGNEENSDWRISEAIVDSLYVCNDTNIMSIGLHDKAQYIV